MFLKNKFLKIVYKTNVNKDIINNNKFSKFTFKNFSDKPEENYTSFGYKTVKKDDRQNMVNQVFANVAKK
jgi:hypothetical protein